MNLGVSTYSYWHFEREKMPINHYLEKASRHGFSGGRFCRTTWRV